MRSKFLSFFRRQLLPALCTISVSVGPGAARADAVSAPAAAARTDAPGQSRTSSDTAVVRKTIGIVLYPGFETLDVFGPVEMWGELPDYQIAMVSQNGGLVKSVQGVETQATYSFANAPQFDILMVPGGVGARHEVNNAQLLEFLRRQDTRTQWTVSVCTGSALLAKAGLLRGRNATSNKQVFAFAAAQDLGVHWQKNARWVVDGKYVTSSGISAGTDMALGLVAKLYSRSLAEKIADAAEYQWNDDPTRDPFARGDARPRGDVSAPPAQSVQPAQ
ncbi:DJ-1/PfpI family protein [Pandoraea sputorum]|uniref:Dimethyladenosine transferase n=1 Tax=Pandoraea sputorum TaxID=93222 RepID=A0A5E5BNH5_9BURK|nr:DJ-1/PfpI family protein [Pandoraea sputorum]VVE85850.1 dimethyladenosine transferase [Pandoraea sputorum]